MFARFSFSKKVQKSLQVEIPTPPKSTPIAVREERESLLDFYTRFLGEVFIENVNRQCRGEPKMPEAEEVSRFFEGLALSNMDVPEALFSRSNMGEIEWFVREFAPQEGHLFDRYE
jgi:hypothetical protein